MKRLRILLTNDDGYKSDLLKEAKDILSDYGEVSVIVPEREKSGCGSALTLFRPIPMRKLEDGTIVLTGTPADCVSYGLSGAGRTFDLVVSGPNAGHNITYDILHSGTIGACVESNLYGVPAIALSYFASEPEKAAWIRKALDYIFENELLSPDYFLNVNFPTSSGIKGIRLSTTAMRPDKRFFRPTGGGVIAHRECADETGLPPESDVWLVNNGYISITPLMASYFHPEILARLLGRIKKK